MKVLLVLLLMGSGSLLAQVKDDFSDNDLKNDPEWLGDLDKFEVRNDELKLASSGTNKSYISTKAPWKDTATWFFYFRLNFAPSTANQLKIYLSFDHSDLSAPGNGYFLRIGESGADDNLEFCRQSGSSITKLAEGNLATMGNSKSNAASIKVSRSTKGTYLIQADFSGGKDYTTDFLVTDLSLAEGSYFGFHCSYTATRANEFFFDNVFIDPIYADNDPPKIVSLSVSSTKQLALVFNEALDSASASNTNNYRLNSEKPISALFSAKNPNNVLLKFANDFVSETAYTLVVNAVKDLVGNAISSESKDFNYFIPAYGDVIINEFLPDPNPSAGLPTGEFVELYNKTKTTIELLNWTIGDALTDVKIPSFVLKPGEFVILCSSTYTADYALFGSVLGLSLPSLNDSGDKLTLKTEQGIIIDFLAYDNTWYQDAKKSVGGYSLERINPYLACSNKENWCSTDNQNGGTPGIQNSIFDNTPDQTAPEIMGINIINSTEIELIFNEQFDSVSVVNAVFSVIGLGSAQVTAISLGNLPTIRLEISVPLVENTYYSISIDGLQDCEGNVLSKTYPDALLYIIAENPMLHNILITEIFADPDPSYGLPMAEFIEIYNNSKKPLLLNQCVLSADEDEAFLADQILMPHTYLILCKSTNTQLFESYGKVMGLSKFPSLNNSGELLTLRNKFGALIHFVGYQDSWYDSDAKKTGGYSLEMIDIANPCGKNDNWTSAKNKVFGTPGRANSQSGNNADLNGPILSSIVALDSLHLQLIFNETMDSSTLYQTANYSFLANADLAIQSLAENFERYESLVVNLQNQLVKNEVYQLQVANLKDCAQNVMAVQSIDFALPEKPQVLDLVINEVLFNPKTGGVDFVEFYNRTNKYLDLSDFLIATKNSKGELSSIAPISINAFLLAPNSYVVITEDPENIEANYFVAKTSYLRLANLPSFGDASGQVILLRLDSLVIDALAYSAEWHYPLLEDLEGISLERINPGYETQSAANWHSASSASGGATPTAINSQFSEKRPLVNTINLSSESFSPDNDGFEDFLGITIASQSLNQSLAIAIYNLNGQLIRNLVDHDILGFESFYQWDGFDNEGKKAPIGVYILLFDIIDLDKGSAEAFKLSTVLAGKL